MSTNRTQVTVFPVHVFIRDELAARGWTTSRLARESGLDFWALSALLRGGTLSPEHAQALGKALEVNPQLFLNLQAQYATRAAR